MYGFVCSVLSWTQALNRDAIRNFSDIPGGGLPAYSGTPVSTNVKYIVVDVVGSRGGIGPIQVSTENNLLFINVYKSAPSVSRGPSGGW